MSWWSPFHDVRVKVRRWVLVSSPRVVGKERMLHKPKISFGLYLDSFTGNLHTNSVNKPLTLSKVILRVGN